MNNQNLACPLCRDTMQEVNREGISIDVCPRCRGVWLDRGELEKLLASARQEFTMQSQDRYQNPAYEQRYPERARHYEDPRYKDHHRRYHKKSKLESLFDIFD